MPTLVPYGAQSGSFFFAKCTLRIPRKGDSTRRTVPASLLRERLKRWRDNDLAQLWNEVVEETASHPRPIPQDPRPTKGLLTSNAAYNLPKKASTERPSGLSSPQVWLLQTIP